ncbi:MAG: four helix bundle protein [Thermodesulfobacteriota bacterium]|nr:four helix bundle protein [Thermodesulfobacteriota bacterium]
MELKELEVYNLSEKLSDTIWDIVIKWDYFARETIGKQLVRAADSIAANIAEGYGRYHYKENKNFCYFARGSLEETKTWLRKSIRRDLIDQSKHQELFDIIKKLPRLLNSYIKSIGTERRSEITGH